MQGMWVPRLGNQEPICSRAIKPMRYNQRSLRGLQPVLHNTRGPQAATREDRALQWRAHAPQWRLSTAKKKKKIKKCLKERYLPHQTIVRTREFIFIKRLGQALDTVSLHFILWFHVTCSPWFYFGKRPSHILRPRSQDLGHWLEQLGDGLAYHCGPSTAAAGHPGHDEETAHRQKRVREWERKGERER